MHELRIAENLIRLRHERKITQEELADYIGVTKGSVSKWEKNISKPDLQTIPVLATFFGVTIDELLGYLPQLSKDQIQKLYLDYSNSFAVSDFEALLFLLSPCLSDVCPFAESLLTCQNTKITDRAFTLYERFVRPYHRTLCRSQSVQGYLDSKSAHSHGWRTI